MKWRDVRPGDMMLIHAPDDISLPPRHAGLRYVVVGVRADAERGAPPGEGALEVTVLLSNGEMERWYGCADQGYFDDDELLGRRGD